jgi:predicted type IV restriction endonuclease
MATVPTRIANRLSEGLKRFQPILESAKSRDINESDTVVLITGILSEILGFDKYHDITTEFAIRGTYCDLALKIDNKPAVLLEAKAVGIELKDAHIKQATDYAANKGLDWVILSNGIRWLVFKIHFTKPIQHTQVFELDLLLLKAKSDDDIELLYVLSKEGIIKQSLELFFEQKQATNKYMIGALLGVDAVLGAIRKELKSIYPDIRVSTDEIKQVLNKEVIKREIFDGEESEEAKKKIARSIRKKEKQQAEKNKPSGASVLAEVTTDTDVKTESDSE